MKTSVTRLLVGSLPGERKPDHALAHRQLTTAKKAGTKVQAAAEVAAFKRSISKLSARQLRDLHARLTARIGKLALQKIMREAGR
jgi:hypothetical protein